MKLIVVTTDAFFDGEPEALHGLFERDLRLLHVRKPVASLEDYRRFILKINPTYHNRIVVHDHYELADELNLRGVHLKKQYEDAPYRNKGFTNSRSCHHFDETAGYRECDYVFLGPVFDSISKTGYKAKFTDDELTKARAEGVIDHRIVALGGITANRIDELRRYGFGGVAVLGALWKDFLTDSDSEGLARRFEELKNECDER